MREQMLARDPTLLVSGDPLDPPEPRKTLAAVAQLVYMVLLLFMFFGDGLFRLLGTPVPEFYVYAQERKVPGSPWRCPMPFGHGRSRCRSTRGAPRGQMMFVFGIYFVGNNIVNSLMSTGAFELLYNGALDPARPLR